MPGRVGYVRMAILSINPKTFKTERGCPFLIKINKKESTYNNQKKKSKKEKITCNNPEERKQEKEDHR